MPSVTSIQNKIDKASNKYNLHDRLIYKRITTIVTVNPMLEVNSSIDTTDTLLDPQPFYGRPESIDIGAFRYPVQVLSADGTVDLSNVDYVLFFSPNTAMSIVFKDVQGNEEEFRVTDFESVPFQGDALGFQVYIKSFKKQNGTTNNNVNNLGG